MIIYYFGVISVCIFVLVSFFMMVKYSLNICRTYKYLKKSSEKKYTYIHKTTSVMIVIPVLREQNVICDTIDYFNNISCQNLNIHLVFAGTKREYESLEKFGFEKSTIQIAREHINHINEKKVVFHLCEADDKKNGDRATQLNYAVEKVLQEEPGIDVIGVYDVDSRPTLDTILEVVNRYLTNPLCSYQQPAFFLNPANLMAEKKENPILIANCIYQNTWSLISEIPMWLSYGKKKGKSNQYLYCIGHGEFFPAEIYKKYHFPEGEVTDGIQIGYRLGILGDELDILQNYCSDDVPHDLSSLINQHRRWYGGCMRICQAYNWCREYDKRSILKKGLYFGGLWSQFRWAYTSLLFILNLALSIYFMIKGYNNILFLFMIFIFVMYCYVIPIISTRITPIKANLSIMPYILIPCAIFVKSIGPNIYILNNLLKKGNKYGKVER